MKYEVTVVRSGSIEVEAQNELEAMRMVKTMSPDDIFWCDDWEVSDCKENEDD